MMVQLLMLMFKFTVLVMSTSRNNYCNIKRSMNYTSLHFSAFTSLSALNEQSIQL